MKRASTFIVATCLFGLGEMANAQCSNISGSNTVSGGYQCVYTDTPGTYANTNWSVTATCSVATCAGPYPSQPYDYPSGTLSGNGQCGTYDTDTMSTYPGAQNCYAAIFTTSTSNDAGGSNIYTVWEIDQSQNTDAQGCINNGIATGSVQVECDYEDCPVCGLNGSCSDDSYCSSGLSCVSGECKADDGGSCEEASDCVSGCCSSNTCGCGDGGGGGGCLQNGDGCSQDYDCCSNHCDGTCDDVDPIIIDLSGRGYELTNASNGVVFDFYGTGSPIRMSWTAAGWNGGFLALDRNGNGRIDNATEMFSNITPQPATPGKTANGFLALAVYDQPANGGNGDGWIDEHDAIYSKLLVWVDKNHNGISEPGELLTLKQAGIQAISLSYAPSQWTDAFGNTFHYKSQLRTNASSDQVVYDVILQRAGRATAPTPETKQ